MWGQVSADAVAGDEIRIIPTRVGTSENDRCKWSSGEDHPHACGDKESAQKAQKASGGSSPRVWGQDIFIKCLTNHIGIIPTRVGTRGYSGSACVVVWDHPHACGDKLTSRAVSLRAEGSSPRVWGQDRKSFVAPL